MLNHLKERFPIFNPEIRRQRAQERAQAERIAERSDNSHDHKLSNHKQELERIGMTLGLSCSYNEKGPWFLIRMSDPAYETHPDGKRSLDFGRLQVLRNVIVEIDKVYGTVQAMDNPRLLHQVSFALEELVKQYCVHYELGGTLTFRHHPALSNGAVSPENQDLVTPFT